MGAQTFAFTGGWQHWPVPDGVVAVFVTVEGGGANAQKGGQVKGRLATKDGQVLYLAVGGTGIVHSGHNGGAGGWPGGGKGGKGVNANGGDGGAGYSAIRLGSTAGKILCAAAGAAGDSGDNGDGGEGGAASGESGHRGNAGSNATGAATGGTPDQGGNGGTSSSGSQFDGENASNGALAPAGDGGDTGGLDGPGGGGGGPGWRSGGGGQAGSDGWAPGGGGGGGSNYTGSLTGALSLRGGGDTGNGRIILEWDNPDPANRRPGTPTDLTPNDGARLKKSSVTFKAKSTDPDADKITLRVIYGKGSSMTNRKTVTGDALVDSGKQASLTINGLDLSTHYYAHVYAVDTHGNVSLGYNSTNFYTDFPPTVPTLHLPSNGASFSGLGSTTFTWTPNDPDSEPQARAEIRWRTSDQGSNFSTHSIPTATHSYVANPGVFDSNTFYLWQVRTRDAFGQWGPWSDPFRFYVTGSRTAPKLLFPIDDEALSVDQSNTFKWKFTDPDQGDSQYKADIRFRVKDTGEWITHFGTIGTPGSDNHWTFGRNTFAAGFVYEWAVRTYDTLSGGVTPSSWTSPQTFRSIITPGSASGDLPAISPAFKGVLGCGDNEVYLAVKGGHHLLDRLGPLTSVKWTRVRDDISKCNISITAKVGDSIAQTIAIMRSWQHELKVFRDGIPVWEGPITRIAIFSDHTEVEAWDVMAWVYRRILKQGYNDSYPNNKTVVERATRIIADALSRDDPNILKYLTRFDYQDDALQSRVKPPWSTTAFDEVDEMAAKAGLDYVVVGRRIILFDTHRPIGRLPIMDSTNFDSAPILTEYGMSYATEYGVTNNAGVYGSAKYDNSATGPIEMLSSAYGDSAAAETTALTPAARQKLQEAFTRQAQRGISNRWPIPVVVRVPDNSTLSADTPVDINSLVPGVWIPLHADDLIRPFSQWQKLDSMAVTQADGREQVQVVMSPAPGRGQDPDKAGAVAEDGRGDGA